MTTFTQTFQVLIAAGQPRGFLDVPTRDPQLMRLQRFSSTAANAVTGAAHSDITTILQSNGFFARPVDGDKPDIAISPGATLRILCSRTTPSVDPVRVVVAVELAELS